MDTQKKGTKKPARRGAFKKRTNMPLPAAELHAILRAADDIIDEGGRTQLAKILKGSKEKKLLELGLDRNPAYGFYSDLTLEQIMEKVDTLIYADFIKTELSGRLPMIVFTPRGWAVERERRAEEFLREWDHWLENGTVPVSMEYLKERNREMILLFLYKILCSGDKKYIPYLRQWEKTDFKKVQAEIRRVIGNLNRRDQLKEAEWQQLLLERSRSLIVRSQQPILLACQECGGTFIFDELDLNCYQPEGLRFQEICPRCKYRDEEPLYE